MSISAARMGMDAELTPEERATYEWQMWVDGVGEAGQRRLKDASVLVTRVGGVGGAAAYELAAAGVGRLILAHGGDVRPSDLNRQLLMTHAALGTPRVDCAARRLRELRPDLDVVAIPENASAENAEAMVAQADVVIDCAPLFAERFALNRAAVRLGRPMVECAMHEFECQVTTIVPGTTPCLRCLYPEDPAHWRRQFPVFGAVAGTVGCLAAVEAIKLVTGVGQPLLGRMFALDLRSMRTRLLRLAREPGCAVCGTPPSGPPVDCDRTARERVPADGACLTRADPADVVTRPIAPPAR